MTMEKKKTNMKRRNPEIIIDKGTVMEYKHKSGQFIIVEKLLLQEKGSWWGWEHHRVITSLGKDGSVINAQ